MPDCLFCNIVAGDVPAQLVLQSERAIAFRDVNPQAPVHVLVIPRAHLADLGEVVAAGGGLLDELGALAHQVAVAEGIADTGYRVVFNTGADAGQSVAHAHGHVLGGRYLAWPPG